MSEYPECERCGIQTNDETRWYNTLGFDLCGKCQERAKKYLYRWVKGVNITIKTLEQLEGEEE